MKRDTSLKPSERYWLAAAYDSDQGKLVIYGGFSGFSGSIKNDTWSYDYTSNSWAEISTVARPPSRLDTSMAYDLVNHRMILFGGITGPPPDFKAFGDTWALNYDGTSGTWQQRAPAINTIDQGNTTTGQVNAYPPEALIIGLLIVTLVFLKIHRR